MDEYGSWNNVPLYSKLEIEGLSFLYQQLIWPWFHSYPLKVGEYLQFVEKMLSIFLWICTFQVWWELCQWVDTKSGHSCWSEYKIRWEMKILFCHIVSGVQCHISTCCHITVLQKVLKYFLNKVKKHQKIICCAKKSTIKT